MTKPTITIEFEPTVEVAALWQGRAACIAPFSAQEWSDLWNFFQTIDGFIEAVVQPLLAIRKGLEGGKAVPVEAMQQLIALTEDAQGASKIMGGVHALMGRFAMVTGGPTKKDLVQ
jgi:hypothetical protein